MNIRAFALFITVGACRAAVEFTYSTMYDVYDFVGKDEVPLPRCDAGCVIFASTVDPADDYASNLIIQDNNQDRNKSIAELSSLFDEKTQQKQALTIDSPASISVINHNAPDAVPSSIVLYVIDKKSIALFTYQLYDAANLAGLTITTDVAITVMSATPFTVTFEHATWANGVTARLAGFDNAYGNLNMDACPVVFSIPFKTSSLFNGFSLQMAVPVISFVFDQRHDAVVTALPEFSDEQSLMHDGFITSAGYNGCAALNKGGVQSFRSPLYTQSGKYSLTTSDNQTVQVTIDVVPNLDDNELTVSDATNGAVYTFNGTQTQSISIISTESIEVSFDNIADDQAFLLRHTAVLIMEPKTNSAETTTQISSTETTRITSTTGPTTTTSGAVHSGFLSAIGAVLLLARTRE